MFRIDGRDFEPLGHDLTAAQDCYLLGHLRASGAMDVLSRKDLDLDRDGEDLLTRLLLSGHVPHVLAGALREEGKPWRREEAERNAERFADLTDPQEKQVLQGALLGLVLGFFRLAGRSWATSPNSSETGGSAAPGGASAAAAISGTSP